MNNTICRDGKEVYETLECSWGNAFRYFQLGTNRIRTGFGGLKYTVLRVEVFPIVDGYRVVFTGTAIS